MKRWIIFLIRIFQSGMPLIFLIVLLSAVLFSEHANGQNMEKITEVKLVYWRAFHGTIEQHIRTDPSGIMYITSYVYKSGDQSSNKPEVLTKDISKEALSDLIGFVNDSEIRKNFSKSKVFVQPDGSKIELTVRENSFGLVFVSQTAFDQNGSDPDRRLGKVVLDMLKLAGIDIAKNELY